MDRPPDFLLQVLSGLASEDEAARLVEDLLTPREIEDLRLRIDIARRLYEGETYEQIQKETRASSTTISRVRRALWRGSGGYRTALARLLPERQAPRR
jgi:TrpR-related protein YerC/YecD